jgi:hypothetical protein
VVSRQTSTARPPTEESRTIGLAQHSFRWSNGGNHPIERQGATALAASTGRPREAALLLACERVEGVHHAASRHGSIGVLTLMLRSQQLIRPWPPDGAGRACDCLGGVRKGDR